MLELIAMVDDVAISSVWPSGAARATAAAPMLVPAPGRFSITNGLPSRCSSFGATSRATISMPPPGPVGTTIVTGRAG